MLPRANITNRKIKTATTDTEHPKQPQLKFNLTFKLLSSVNLTALSRRPGERVALFAHPAVFVLEVFDLRFYVA